MLYRRFFGCQAEKEIVWLVVVVWLVVDVLVTVAVVIVSAAADFVVIVLAKEAWSGEGGPNARLTIGKVQLKGAIVTVDGQLFQLSFDDPIMTMGL